MARFTKHVIFIVVIIILILSFTVVAAHAQAESSMKLHISSVSPIEKDDSMLLRIYFNLYYTQTGKPVLENAVKNAEIVLSNRNFPISPQIKKPSDPIYIVLLLDSSGSMVGAAPNLKKAANLALDNIPDNSFFSVVQFDETIKMLQDFNDNPYIIRDAIDRQYTPDPYKGTCLYDAAYSAVEQLERPTSQISTSAGRRAIILFTDGKDENPNGKPCSKHTYAELINLASKVDVPINPIGLSYKDGAVDELELNNMANSTRGFSAIAKNDDEMTAAFTNIMNTLKSQWMVEATIYPHKDSVTKATLTLNLLNDQKLVEENIPIVSGREYTGPSSPVTASANLKPNAPQQAYDLHLSLTSPELVDHIEISIKDGNAGTTIIKTYPPATELTTDNHISLSTQSLTFNSAYQLSIIAFPKQNGAPFAMCTDQNGKSQTECLIPFTFDASFYPSLTLQPAKEENSNLLLAINVTQPDLVGGFEGWLVDENNSRVQNSDFKSLLDTQPIPSELTIPLRTKHIPPGKYTLMVRLLSPSGDAYTNQTYNMDVTYAGPSDVEKFIEGLKAYWYISLIILLIIGFTVGFLVKNTKRRKATVQPPIMDIADDESVLPRGQSSYRSPTKPVTHSIKSAGSVSEWSAAGPTIIDDKSSAKDASIQTIQTAQITVEQSADSTAQSLTLVNQYPFIMGRIKANLIIKDPNLSRRHAQITYDDMRREYFLTDLGSSNGTYLDNQRLMPNQPIRILSGAIIKLGKNTIIRFDLY